MVSIDFMVSKDKCSRACLRFFLLLALFGSPAVADDEWSHHGADRRATKFADLTQIHAGNFDSLRILWRWKTGDQQIIDDEGVESAGFRNTPIVVDGVLYTISPLNRVSALDAATGTELWTFDPKAWKLDGFYNGYARGVSYWHDPGTGEGRIIFGTASSYLYSLDAKTGEPDSSFGDDGRIDLTEGLGREFDRRFYAFITPPVISHGVIVVGSSLVDWRTGREQPALVPPGDVRGFDVHTGEKLWTFHTIPHDGEFGADTWEPGAWQEHGAANVWTQMSLDEELGYVYLPVSTPDNDFYGGERPGDNLFGESLVCLDVRTGERVWHFQTVHHGLWDYDLAAAPILLDVVVDGRPIKAVAQITKQAFTFVFDRVTGEPIWPIVERPVPPSNVPGEVASPTQPFPTKPAAFDLQGLSEDDLIDFTPELRAQAIERIGDRTIGPLYTPPTENVIMMTPGSIGGADWTGAVVNPQTGVLYVPSRTLPRPVWVRAPKTNSAVGHYRYIGNSRFRDGPQGLPLTKPPYSRITAIDLNTGDHVWMRPMGRGPVDHPAIRHLNLPDLGWPRFTFVIGTPELLFVTTAWMRGGGDYFREPEMLLSALDPVDGHLVGTTPLPQQSYGGLITFEHQRRQMIVATVGEEGQAELVALAIPRPDEALPPQLVERVDAEHPRFYDAVDLMDAGEVDGLRGLLAAEGEALIHARGYLDESYEDGYFAGSTLLHHVALNPTRQRAPDNHLDILQVLLDAGADPNTLNHDDNSPLLLAITGRQLWRQEMMMPVLKSLVGAGADPAQNHGRAIQAMLTQNRLTDPIYRSAIDLMVSAGVPHDIRFAAAMGDLDRLESHFGDDERLRDEAIPGFESADRKKQQDILDRALQYAAHWGQTDAADLLVRRGADINAQPPGVHGEWDLGATPLHRAADAGQGTMIRWLVARGADLSIEDNQWNATPLNWARYSQTDSVHVIMQELQKVWEEAHKD
ncbi:MAG: PQQ-binding-like beta-propeller repeat protein [Gemmatimonadetes bacterium]|jgi:quinoprotein glucose dehydrogenase|nr:PQQ-binding-like beta-propeller repeat protein [Gemmatimonadota bacterium]MBT5591472.1 PQQ-binding-like beta-propeller repeat protein [Gemmatimonadota bacterium]MBT5962073.1 PQQ-binding-like beta-propeller repeat protein [Gemmatimonadota bacterium]MBT7453010.1 PQQ-binding-like beta-propeller repeat protein [Gemmatimonadota bacterium]MBT7593729.1 PQQ-binding-like beta-propeller repeat protein [Gemmatimonadota bacterium]